MVQDANLAAMAEALSRSADYRVLRRLVPRTLSALTVGRETRIGILLDTETTGLDHRKDVLQEMRGQGPPRGLSLLQDRLDLPDRPAFAFRDHAHLGAGTDPRMGANVVLDGFDDELRLGLPAEGQIEISGKDLPTRAIFQLDDVTFRMGPNPHRFAATVIRSTDLRCVSPDTTSRSSSV